MLFKKDNKLDLHSHLIFLEFKVKRDKVIVIWIWCSLMWLFPTKFYFFGMEKKYFNWKLALKICLVQSVFLMSVLCYADHDFFFLLSHEELFQMCIKVSHEAWELPMEVKLVPFLWKTCQQQSVSLISLTGTHNKLRLNEKACEIFVFICFNWGFVL